MDAWNGRLPEVKARAEAIFKKIDAYVALNRRITVCKYELLKKEAEKEIQTAIAIFKDCLQKGIESGIDRDLEFVFAENPVVIGKMKENDEKYLLEFGFSAALAQELPMMARKFENGELFRFKYMSTKRGRNVEIWERIIVFPFRFVEDDCWTLTSLLGKARACNDAEWEIICTGNSLACSWEELSDIFESFEGRPDGRLHHAGSGRYE